MKHTLLICCIMLCTKHIFAQQWAEEQLQKANTFFDETRLSDAEKETIKYINLCRLYPAAFAEKELKNFEAAANAGDKNFASYKESLAKELATKQPCQALQPDDLLYDDAKCYGNEISKNKRKPHERIDCIKRNYAECIYYGNPDAKNIAMQWLIDSGVETLGHRKMVLQPAFRKAGIKINTHFEYGHCAVLELSK